MNLPTTADIAAVLAADDTARREAPRSVVIVCTGTTPSDTQIEALRRHFELTAVIPDWNGSDALPSTGRLVITRVSHPRVFGTRLPTHTLAQALRMVGGAA